MDDEFREQLIGYGTFTATKENEITIEEGKPQTRLYVVVAGVFNVTTKAAGRDVLLDSVEAGDCFGEVSLFQPGQASATVTCARSGHLWIMESEALQQFLYDFPSAGCALILGVNTILSRRLKRANAVIRANQIVPAFLSVRSRKRVETAQAG